jgi:hypothetical protein
VGVGDADPVGLGAGQDGEGEGDGDGDGEGDGDGDPGGDGGARVGACVGDGSPGGGDGVGAGLGAGGGSGACDGSGLSVGAGRAGAGAPGPAGPGGPVVRGAVAGLSCAAAARVAPKNSAHQIGAMRTTSPVVGAWTIRPRPRYTATWWMEFQWSGSGPKNSRSPGSIATTGTGVVDRYWGRAVRGRAIPAEA